MKQLLMFVFFTLCLFTSVASCDKDSAVHGAAGNSNHNFDTTRSKMKIKIGAHTFTATLYDNATANALKSLLPMTVNMTELNENEKYFHFSTNLPANASKPGTIHTGDLMLWGSNSLVLFYKTFSTSYSYTKIGRIDDPTELAAAVGSGNVMVTFDLLQRQ